MTNATKKKIDTDFHYYLLNFSYFGPTSSFGDLPESSVGVSAAEETVENIAKQNNIIMRHAYAWPDGSLYKYICTQGPCDEAKLRQLFVADLEVVEKKTGKTFKVGVRLSQTHEEKQPFRLSGAQFFTVQELFAVPPEEKNKLIVKRMKQKDAFYADYKKSRDTCPTCRPGHMACDTCLKVLSAADAKYKAWKETDRPFTPFTK